jgi:hypothetical protein
MWDGEKHPFVGRTVSRSLGDWCGSILYPTFQTTIVAVQWCQHQHHSIVSLYSCFQTTVLRTSLRKYHTRPRRTGRLLDMLSSSKMEDFPSFSLVSQSLSDPNAGHSTMVCPSKLSSVVAIRIRKHYCEIQQAGLLERICPSRRDCAPIMNKKKRNQNIMRKPISPRRNKDQCDVPIRQWHGPTLSKSMTTSENQPMN